MGIEYASQRLDILRASRVKTLPRDDLAEEFDDAARRLAKLERQLGSVSSVWCSVCPTELLEKSRIVQLSRGVLTIGASDSATRFEIDRFLRSGGTQQVLQSTAASIRKIKVVLHSDGFD